MLIAEDQPARRKTGLRTTAARRVPEGVLNDVRGFRAQIIVSFNDAIDQ
jgi:hypothetical protein